MYSIDFFELSFLAEACIPPAPIARMTFWYKLINDYYHEMDSNERLKLYKWIYSNSRFTDNINHDDCQLFITRFNPDNQYKVTVEYEGKLETADCFLWNNQYRLSKTMYVPSELITNIEKI